MTFHPGVLSIRQSKLLHKLGPLLTSRHFYLAGGTALALRLGHRRSVDLDWMTPRRITDPARLAASLRGRWPRFRISSTEPGTLHLRISGVRVSLLEYRYPLLKQQVSCPDFRCDLASLDDLAGMKLSALAQRGSRKDFVDVYALMTAHAPLRRLVKLYLRKFRLRDMGPLLFALAYFPDAEAEPMPSMIWDVRWDRIKDVIRRATRELSR